MAKSQKYLEDQLLDAVVKYSEIERKKIKATELAKWCRDNIEGLEEVRDYHFTRSMKERDKATGKMIEKRKRCTLKIEEINRARSLTVSINTNILLRASNIDTFMELSNSLKRKMIVETRETVDKLLVRNGNITRENTVLKAENKTIKSDILNLTGRINALQKTQKKLTKQVSYLMKIFDEATRKEMLSQMGIADNMIDLETYVNCLQQDLNEIMNINKVLREYASMKREYETKSSVNNKEELSDTIMSGLKF